MTASRGKTRDMAQTALFAVVIAVCAWISVPTAVPFTMQTFGVFLAMGVLGGKRGTLSVLLYMLLGAVGLPVFSGFSGGLGAFAGVTGGYLLGFLLMALVMWLGERLFGPGDLVFVLSGIAGLAVCYLFGTAWFLLLYTGTRGPIGIWAVLSSCVLPFLIPDGVKLALALLLRRRLRQALRP